MIREKSRLKNQIEDMSAQMILMGVIRHDVNNVKTPPIFQGQVFTTAATSSQCAFSVFPCCCSYRFEVWRPQSHISISYLHLVFHVLLYCVFICLS
ncbi:hypothetical protein WH47_03097 [Habropoda laboriosa]|uniref:Uncharacterized protein n=1 Tax=Habropoda laboriosa TaxID=597456 RepID=A0A0L7QY96_9HYME|nr:hypothetical protein WH47_03097 [Habropoda laboriosa]